MNDLHRCYLMQAGGCDDLFRRLADVVFLSRISTLLCGNLFSTGPRYNMPSFRDLLAACAFLNEERDEIRRVGGQVSARYEALEPLKTSDATLTPESCAAAKSLLDPLTGLMLLGRCTQFPQRVH